MPTKTQANRAQALPLGSEVPLPLRPSPVFMPPVQRLSGDNAQALSVRESALSPGRVAWDREGRRTEGPSWTPCIVHSSWFLHTHIPCHRHSQVTHLHTANSHHTHGHTTHTTCHTDIGCTCTCHIHTHTPFLLALRCSRGSATTQRAHRVRCRDGEGNFLSSVSCPLRGVWLCALKNVSLTGSLY